MKVKVVSLIVGMVVVLVLCLFLMFWTGQSRHLAARDLVQSVGGYWSAEPGWPGGHTVSIGINNCDLLPDLVLEEVVLAQVYNLKLRYLGLAGQHVTDRIAHSILMLKSLETLDLRGSRIDPSEARLIVSSPSLKIIIVSSINESTFAEAIDQTGAKTEIEIRTMPL